MHIYQAHGSCCTQATGTFVRCLRAVLRKPSTLGPPWPRTLCPKPATLTLNPTAPRSCNAAVCGGHSHPWFLAGDTKLVVPVSSGDAALYAWENEGTAHGKGMG